MVRPLESYTERTKSKKYRLCDKEKIVTNRKYFVIELIKDNEPFASVEFSGTGYNGTPLTTREMLRTLKSLLSAIENVFTEEHLSDALLDIEYFQVPILDWIDLKEGRLEKEDLNAAIASTHFNSYAEPGFVEDRMGKRRRIDQPVLAISDQTITRQVKRADFIVTYDVNSNVVTNMAYHKGTILKWEWKPEERPYTEDIPQIDDFLSFQGDYLRYVINKMSDETKYIYDIGQKKYFRLVSIDEYSPKEKNSECRDAVYQ